MNLDELKTLIKYLQCKQGKFAAIVANKLALGICSDEYLYKLTLTSYLLEVFYRMNTVLAAGQTFEDVNCLTICEFSAIKDKFISLMQ